MLTRNITFIGGGNMAEGIIRGLCGAHIADPSRIDVYDILDRRLDYLSETYGVNAVADMQQAAGNAEITFIAVRPQDAPGVLAAIAENRKQTALVVSICAGITLSHMEKSLGAETPIARVMPNVLLDVKHGYSGICPNASVNSEDKADLEAMFSALGQTLFMDEAQFDAFTAFSCAGPAYVMHCIEGLIDAGVLVGFSRYDARNMVLENCIGSATLLQTTDLHPFQQVDRMTSPAGVTIEGVSVLNGSGLTGILMNAVKAALDRTRELS